MIRLQWCLFKLGIPATFIIVGLALMNFAAKTDSIQAANCTALIMAILTVFLGIMVPWAFWDLLHPGFKDRYGSHNSEE